MRQLKFKVSGQELIRDPSCDFSGIIAGTSGYLQLVVEFDSTWDDTVQAAAFYASDQASEDAWPLIDGKCLVPDNAAACITFKVGIVGQRKDGQRITTNLIRVRQEKGSGQSWQR